MFRTGQIIETTLFKGMIVEMFDLRASLKESDCRYQYSIVLLDIYDTETFEDMSIGECLYQFGDIKTLKYLVTQEYGKLKYLGGF